MSVGNNVCSAIGIGKKECRSLLIIDSNNSELLTPKTVTYIEHTEPDTIESSIHHHHQRSVNTSVNLTIKSLTASIQLIVTLVQSINRLNTMALSTLRDTTVVLIDYTDYTPWLNQTKAKCQSLRVWDLIDPSSSTEPMPLPELPQCQIDRSIQHLARSSPDVSN